MLSVWEPGNYSTEKWWICSNMFRSFFSKADILIQDKQKLSTWLVFHPKSFSVCCWWEPQRFIKASVKSVSGDVNCFYHTGIIEKEPIFDRFLYHQTRHLISLSWYVACLIAWCMFTMVFGLNLLNTQKSCFDQNQIIVVCNIFSVNKWK